MTTRISHRGPAALVLAAALALGAGACSSGGSDGAGNAAASSKAADSGTTGQGSAERNGVGGSGPCRDTMKHITEAGQKLTADMADKAKATAHLEAIAKQFGEDAEKIKHPEGKAAAKKLSEVYGKLAQNARTNQAPDMATLPGTVQESVAALGQCAAAE
ncbi:hypothetical protein ACIA8O_15325 [Kitasatospora sp. NPDC051853]|uniref:hypothetical protein n=1 Tax=Kitasatospora sp. NPDC051853 TaxID=3364058 RepID=UPI0037BD9662